MISSNNLLKNELLKKVRLFAEYISKLLKKRLSYQF